MAPPLSRGGIPVAALAAAALVGFAAAMTLQWLARQPANISSLVSPGAKCAAGPAAESGKDGKGLLVDRSSRKRAPPGPNGYLIIGEFDFYRFTNNKIQLIEALAMAVRTLELAKRQSVGGGLALPPPRPCYRSKRGARS